MIKSSPLNTVKNLVEAINDGDLDTALSLYEPQAVLIVQPGKIARGRDAIRTALEGFISLKPSLKGDAHQVVEAGEVSPPSSLLAKKRSLLPTLLSGQMAYTMSLSISSV